MTQNVLLQNKILVFLVDRYINKQCLIFCYNNFYVNDMSNDKQMAKTVQNRCINFLKTIT